MTMLKCINIKLVAHIYAKKLDYGKKNVVSFAVANDKWDYSPDVQVVSFKSQS